MRTQFMLIRIITAAVLFMILAQANVWADTSTHLTLAVGYRAFLLAAPMFMFFGIARGMQYSLILGVASLVLAFYSFNSIAIGLLALSMAVSGYICKYINSSTVRGAADNKVALNIGSLVAGILVMFSSNKFNMLSLSVVLMIGVTVLSFLLPWNKLLISESAVEQKKSPKNEIKYLPLIGWSLIGIATGIKLTGIFAILPQYLIHKTGGLPTWYGSMIILNSLGVIFLQHYILKYLDVSKKFVTVLFSLSAMTLLAIPNFMHIENLGMAILWIVLLTGGECALSRYDKLAKDEGYLFPKELMVGVGSFATVALSRHYSDFIYLSGLLGILTFTAGIILVAPRQKVARCLNPVGGS